MIHIHDTQDKINEGMKNFENTEAMKGCFRTELLNSLEISKIKKYTLSVFCIYFFKDRTH